MNPQHAIFTSDNPSLSVPLQRTREAVEPITELAIDCNSRTSCPADAPVQLIAVGLGTDVTTYVRASLSESTKRAYRADVTAFTQWGGNIPASAGCIARYLADQACELAPVSLRRRLVGIGKAHVAAGFADPTKAELVRATMRGICRVHGRAQRQAAPLLREDVLLISDALGQGLVDVRDRALVLLGFAGGFRRSELVSLQRGDVNFVPEGAVITIRRSKTDQEGRGRKIGIPFGRTRACPVKAVKAWLDRGSIEDGPLFRSIGKGGRVGPALTAQSVSLVLRRCAGLTGLSSIGLSAHSLRAGLVTSAVRAGISSWKIRQQTGHRSDAVMSTYIRDAEMFVGNAAGALL